MTILSTFFFEQLQHRCDAIRQKNNVFSTRLKALQTRYGGGTRCARELDTIVREDSAFIERVLNVAWEELAREKLQTLSTKILTQDRDIKRDSLVFAWDCDSECLRLQRASSGRLTLVARHRHPVVLSFEEIFEQLIILEHLASQSYPIIFGHDLENNHRAMLSSILISLCQEVLGALNDEQAASELGVTKIAFSLPSHDIVHTLWETDKERTRPMQIDAEILGWQKDRELERGLNDYVAIDPEAHFAHFLAERIQGEVERCDFLEPSGKAWHISLCRDARHLVTRFRDKPMIVRKRTHRFIDESSIKEACHRFHSDAELERAFEDVIYSKVTEGFRLVYAYSETNGAEHRRGALPLSWDNIEPE